MEKNGFGFMRGKLPKSEAYFDIDEKEYPDSRNIMLRVTSEGADGFKLTPVPGLHVVAGSNKAEYWDALSAFQNMLRLGFHGGPNCNVNLADSDPQHTLKNFRYPENPSMDKSVTTVRSGIEGDEYAYLLWSGFTSNYLPTSEVDMHVNPYGQGTVAHCPPSRFEPYIILAEGANPHQRIDAYNTIFSPPVTTPIAVLNHRFEPITTLYGENAYSFQPQPHSSILV